MLKLLKKLTKELFHNKKNQEIHILKQEMHTLMKQIIEYCDADESSKVSQVLFKKPYNEIQEDVQRLKNECINFGIPLKGYTVDIMIFKCG
ncbi:MAG: hypothetical protein A2X09_15065 [Bacteroidetes bacterium GWF2_43_11]|nr:MAG: hypothetical protein A2X09_15065 [Bacteroidetes bacterium GWF2_43_11]